MNQYRKLNLDKLTFSDKITSYEDALRGAVPLYSRKVEIIKVEKDRKNKRVKLEKSC